MLIMNRKDKENTCMPSSLLQKNDALILTAQFVLSLLSCKLQHIECHCTGLTLEELRRGASTAHIGVCVVLLMNYHLEQIEHKKKKSCVHYLCAYRSIHSSRIGKYKMKM